MMKNHMRIFNIVLAASLFATMVNLASAEPPSDSIGPGMMNGYGSGYGMGTAMGSGMTGGYGPGMMGFGNYRELNLSDEQKSKITEIRHEMRNKQWAVMGELMDAQDKLQELYDEDKQDPAAIKKQYKALEDLRLKMVDNAIDAHNRIDGILTKEQREKSRELSRSYGPMMRGY